MIIYLNSNTLINDFRTLKITVITKGLNQEGFA